MKRTARVVFGLAIVAAAFFMRAVTPVAEVAKGPEIMARFEPAASLRVLNVWATWCVPCVAEMRDLQAIHTRFATRGVSLLGVSMDDAIPGDRTETKAKVSRFLATKGITYPNLYFVGPPTRIQDALSFEGEIPITIVFDRKGRELLRVQGRIEPKTLEADLERLLVQTK